MKDPEAVTDSGAAPEADGTARRRYRHRGPRRATGGTRTSQGEPERLAGFASGGGPGEPKGAPGNPSAGEAGDDRGRWLLEQRPPHWG